MSRITPIENRILFEDNHILIVNKLSSEITQGDNTGDKPITAYAQDYLKKKYNKPGNVFIGLPHRLDRPTSGAIVLARTSKALSRLTKMFANQEVNKIYLAITDNPLPDKQGKLEHYLVRNPNKNKSFAYDKKVNNSKKAILEYELFYKLQRYFVYKITLHTGRHHQIRAQLAKMNCHIKGDLKYGFPRSNPNGGIHLHAYEVSFQHPISKEIIKIKAPFPEDSVWKLIK